MDSVTCQGTNSSSCGFNFLLDLLDFLAVLALAQNLLPLLLDFLKRYRQILGIDLHVVVQVEVPNGSQ